MNRPKISRSQCRETAFQVLFGEFFHDRTMAASIASTEASYFCEAFQNAITVLTEHQKAAEAGVLAMKKVIKILADATEKQEKFPSAKAQRESLNSAVLHLGRVRGEATEALRFSLSALQNESMMFDQSGFSMRLLRTFDRHRQEIESALEKALEGWALRRLTAEDGTVLRLGATELMFFQDIPPVVIVNEYIDLGKQYGDKDSSSLVNGVLDRIMQDYPRKAKTAEKDE